MNDFKNLNFNVGDKVVCRDVRSADSIGYLGFSGQITLTKIFNHETLYCVQSSLGSGFGWFYNDELVLTK